MTAPGSVSRALARESSARLPEYTGAQHGRFLTPSASSSSSWVCVDDGSQRRRVPREPLRKEEVLRCPVDVGDRRVPQLVEAVVAVEPGALLPPREPPLSCTLREPPSLTGYERQCPLRERLSDPPSIATRATESARSPAAIRSSVSEGPDRLEHTVPELAPCAQRLPRDLRCLAPLLRVFCTEAPE